MERVPFQSRDAQDKGLQQPSDDQPQLTSPTLAWKTFSRPRPAAENPLLPLPAMRDNAALRSVPRLDPEDLWGTVAEETREDGPPTFDLPAYDCYFTSTVNRLLSTPSTVYWLPFFGRKECSAIFAAGAKSWFVAKRSLVGRHRSCVRT